MPIDANAMGQAIATEITTADAALPAPLPTTEAIRLLMMQALARGIAAELIPKLTFADHADVNLTGLADGDMLTYDAGTQKWVVSAPAPGNYLPLAGGTLTGDLTINKANPGITLTNQASGYEDHGIKFVNYQDQLQIQRRTGESYDAVLVTIDRATGEMKVGANTVWHAGNDGSGSGLDADTVDGLHAENLAKLSARSDGYFWVRRDSGNAAVYITHQSTGRIVEFRQGANDGTVVAVVENDGRFRSTDGSVSTPGFSFLADPDTGMFRYTTNTLRLATGGGTRMQLDGTTTTVYNMLYASGGLRLRVV